VSVFGVVTSPSSSGAVLEVKKATLRDTPRLVSGWRVAAAAASAVVIDVNPGFFQRPQLFVGAPEQHRIAALQTHDDGVLARIVDQLLVDELLRRRQLAAAFAHRDLFRLRAQFQHLGRDQRVMQHHAGGSEQARAAQRDQVLGAGAGADQIDCSESRHRVFPDYPKRIIPAATVWWVTSSIRMKAPVARMSS
jgi:hypothetical protein